MKKRGQEGMVSMLTVVFLSILLSLITTAFVRVAVSEQRNATNDDLSTRAYYAAQSGFEDAIRYLKGSNPTSNSTCTPVAGGGQVASPGSGIDAAYTCELISLNVDSLTFGSISNSSAVMFPINPLNSNSDDYSLQIQWTSAGTALPGNKALIPVDNWTSQGFPAMLRTELVWFPSSGTLSSSSTQSQAYYLMPSANSNSTSKVDLTGSGSVPSEPILNSSCAASGGVYTCTGTIPLTGFSSRQAFVVLRPIYTSVTGVTLTLNDTTQSGSPQVTFASGQASVDITGRAGDVYRRIKQNVPYGKYQVGTVNVPDFSLVGGNGICKQTTVGSSASNYTAGTPCP